MFFTQEDYRKIEDYLKRKSIKDTQFDEAITPLNGGEEIAFVQNGKNVKTHVKDIVEQLFLLGVSDFMNITDKYNQSYIDLKEAIDLIPFRKKGQVITFINKEGDWVIYQFKGYNTSQWNNTTLWVNLFESIYINSILPDEEDLTKTDKDEQDNVRLKFKDKVYNPEKFSGLGRVYLRKNIMEGKNVLLQEMISEPNTIYHIQYDYDLNEQELSLPENCVLKFEGGSINNGNIIFNNTIIDKDNKVIFNNCKFIIPDRYIEDISKFPIGNISSINVKNDNKWDEFSNLLKFKIVELDEDYSITVPTEECICNPTLIINGNTHTVTFNDDPEIEGYPSEIQHFATNKHFGSGNPSSITLNNIKINYNVRNEVCIDSFEWGATKKLFNSSNFYINNCEIVNINSNCRCFEGGATDKYKTDLIIKDSKITYSYFIAEAMPNNILIYNSTLLRNTKAASNRGAGDALSAGTISSKHIRIINSTLGGGIELNKNDDSQTVDIYIDNCILDCNVGFGARTGVEQLSSKKVDDIYIKNSIFKNLYNTEDITTPKFGFFGSENIKNLTFDRCTFYLGKNYSDYNINSSSCLSGLYIDNINILNCNINICDDYYTNRHRIYGLFNLTQGKLIETNFKFENNKFHSDIKNLAFYYTASLEESNYYSFFKDKIKHNNNIITGDKQFVYFSDNYHNSPRNYSNLFFIKTDSINLLSNYGNNRYYHLGNIPLSSSVSMFINTSRSSNEIPSNIILNVSNPSWRLYINSIIFDNAEIDYNPLFYKKNENDKSIDIYLLTNKTISPINIQILYNNGYKPINELVENIEDLINIPSGYVFGHTEILSNIEYAKAVNGDSFLIRANNTLYNAIKYNDKFIDNNGFTFVTQRRGAYTERPTTLSSDDIGFQYYDITLQKPIYWNGNGWKDSLGDDLANNSTSGNFSQKPNNPKIGFAYYCTDKQTTEGSRNGIMIYYAGGNTWVDALGRVVS